MDYTLTKTIAELKEEIRHLKEINSDMYEALRAIIKDYEDDEGLIIPLATINLAYKVLVKVEGKDA